MKYLTPPLKELVTPEQYANAETHWTKLIAGDISGMFDMQAYTAKGFGQEYIANRSHTCGTAGCSAGYLPETLQIPFEVLKDYWAKDAGMGSIIAIPGLRFLALIKDYIGISIHAQVEGSGMYGWCFDSLWVKSDNSAKGAGIRTRILYEEGLPINWIDQMRGQDPLMYADELNAE